jgi:cytochrome b6-f complex iron-sulfur subunit
MSAPTTGGETSRRKFIVLAVAGAFALAIVDAARIALTFLKPQPKTGFGGVVTAGAVTDFPLGSLTHVRQGRFFIVHLDDGLLALYQRCTHLGCLVPWSEAEGRFACPCHAGRYNRVGEVLSGPPPRPLDLFSIKIVNGQVLVDTSQVVTRQRYEPSQVVKG